MMSLHSVLARCLQPQCCSCQSCQCYTEQLHMPVALGEGSSSWREAAPGSGRCCREGKKGPTQVSCSLSHDNSSAESLRAPESPHSCRRVCQRTAVRSTSGSNFINKHVY